MHHGWVIDWRVAVGCALGAASCSVAAAVDGADPSLLPPAVQVEVDYERDIRPLLENSCYRCHSGERPRSRYDLTERDAALRGGSTGEVAIVPGDSAASPLIHYVARLIEGMEMPPPGRDEPLSVDQISLLRAWIDQGAAFGEATDRVPSSEFDIALAAQGFSVSGNEAKFREHVWMPEGFAGGIQRFRMKEPVGVDGTLTVTGRVLPGLEDYAVELDYRHKRLGFVRGGFSQYRRWFDSTGGYYAPFGVSAFRLEDDPLHLDTSRIWIEAGVDGPDLPRVTVGYEYHLREGERSTLQWGLVRDADVLPPTPRAIYPALKKVEEQVHVIRLDFEHEVAGVRLEDEFRAEFADLRSERTNVDSYVLGDAEPAFATRYRDGFRYFEGANTLRLEKAVNDWLFLSGGYLYSNLEGEASFSSESYVPSDPALGPFAGDSADEIVLRRESNVLNVNAQLGPWQALTLAAGAQGDWTKQDGLGQATIGGFPAPLDANLNRQATSEYMSLRFTGVPYVVLHAEGRLQQESLDQYERQTVNDGVSTGDDFLRDTEARSDLWEVRTGFAVSPWAFLTLDASYRLSRRDTSYDHVRESDGSAISGNGYPGFIVGRDVTSEEIQTRLVWRPAGWLKTTLKYQHIESRIDSVTDEVMDPFSGAVLSGGRLLAGRYNADVYSMNVTVTPWRRLLLNATVSLSDAETVTGLESASVAPYAGQVYSVIASATFTLDSRSEWTAAYSFSKADYDQRGELDGLPLGLVYDRHGLVTGLNRRFKHGVSAYVQYAFYQYDEPTSGGALDYTAHGVLVGIRKSIP